MKRLLLLVALLALFPRVAAAAVAFANNGNTTVTAGTGTCTPATTTLGTVGPNDIILLVATGEHDRTGITLSTANGFEAVPDSPQFGGDGDATEENPEIGMAVFWVRGSNWSAAPVVADSGDHTSCALHRFTGAETVGNPWDVTAGGNDSNANDTSASIPGDTTTVADTLVVLIQGTSNNATVGTNCGAVTNADLGSITERFDSANTSGLGGGHCIITGTKASIGAYAASTLTMSATTFKGAISIALKPPQTAGPPAYDSFSQSGGEANPNWTHTPTGTPKGVIVWVLGPTGTTVASVTYGGSAMTVVDSATKADPEGGLTATYFLGTSVPSGAQTVAVDLGGATGFGVALTLTASTNLEVVDHDTVISASVADPSVTLSLGGRASFAAIGFWSGQDAVTGITPLSSWSVRLEVDGGTQVLAVYSYDVIGTTDVTAGWTQTAEDAIAAAVAVAEVVGGGPTCEQSIALLGVGCR